MCTNSRFAFEKPQRARKFSRVGSFGEDNRRDTREVSPINILRETLGNAVERFFGRVQR